MSEDDQDNSKRRSRSDRPDSFSAVSFLWRFLMALVLVMATYNPSEFSVFHWIRGAEDIGAVHFFVGVLLLIGWVVLWVATWRSLDTLGVVLAVALLGTLVWLLISAGILTPVSASGIAWIVLICLATLLAVGLSWSHIWRRLTGQYTVDEE
ncbi:MAG: DUF6524 family protein [Gammaproteobacteria bacterium]|nr:DUF6524 family protein [Gammaproteobacteria bacterium]MDP6615964.1 DUF6524 family protein [Gammaproteobacteria bacterium]MDP7042096.1 DUF6524 family protein [Gammaproteobacteria bacterium]